MKHYLVVYPTSSTSVLPRFLWSVFRCCIPMPAALQWHRDPLQVGDTQVWSSAKAPSHLSSACSPEVLLAQKCFQTDRLHTNLGLILRTAKGLGWRVQQASFKMQVLGIKNTPPPLCPWCECSSPLCWTALWHQTPGLCSLQKYLGPLWPNQGLY